MRIDQQTVQDLEVLGTVSRAPGLLDHLDRTRTRGGREVLKRRLLNPLESTKEIRVVQDSLAWIAARGSLFERLPTELRLKTVARYLDSRFATQRQQSGPAATLESLWIRLRYSDLYDEAKNGVAQVRGFLVQIEDFATSLEEAPSLLREHAAEMRRHCDYGRLRRIRSRRVRPGAWRRTLLDDRFIREEGRFTLRRLIELVHEIDALVSMAEATSRNAYCFPAIADDEHGVEIEGMYHPFLEAPVRNCLHMSGDSRVVFLTGPNMAGKTTYLKASGIVVLLAHTGMGVPAERCSIGLQHRLISAMRTRDSLRDGISYFQAEARRVKEIIEPVVAGERCFIVVDELFRGTNVKDACDASLRVIRAFAGAARGHFVIASHLIELASDLEQTAGIMFCRFEAELAGGAVRFDYRLAPGVSGQRLGMKVLEQEGVLAALDAIRPRRRTGPEGKPDG